MARMTREERALGRRKPPSGSRAAGDGLEARLARAARNMPVSEGVDPETFPDPEFETVVDPAEDEALADDDEIEWTADFAPETETAQADPAEEVAAPELTYREARDVTDADIDRLWDWVRADEDTGLRFLGRVPVSHGRLVESVAAFGHTLVAIDEKGVHVGFGAFSPVTDTYAMIHLYLCADVRGRLPEFAPSFIAASQQLNPGRKLSILVDTPAEMRLYRKFGFTAKHILTLDPPATV